MDIYEVDRSNDLMKTQSDLGYVIALRSVGWRVHLWLPVKSGSNGWLKN